MIDARRGQKIVFMFMKKEILCFQAAENSYIFVLFIAKVLTNHLSHGHMSVGSDPENIGS